MYLSDIENFPKDWDEADVQPTMHDLDRIRQAKSIIQREEKTPVEVIADNLEGLFNNSIQEMRKERGGNVVDDHPFHLVITVPAVWKEGAIRRMKKALDLSGALGPRPNRIPGTTYKFLTEPEVAGMASFQSLAGSDTLVPGDSFVVADLGGGTTVRIPILSSVQYLILT